MKVDLRNGKTLEAIEVLEGLVGQRERGFNDQDSDGVDIPKAFTQLSQEIQTPRAAVELNINVPAKALVCVVKSSGDASL